ncbi:MAG: hypothetical protein JRE65_14980 [Deltaproteobacteria bacterium]|jgi:hypothetical protein|nr:hypothetical protein [Deltaproteobacteria bacterium]
MMIIQREVHNADLAKLLQNIDEKEKKLRVIKTGKHGPFKPFNAIKIKGKCPSAYEMVIQDRL